jgi:hypothetical protein
MFGSPAALSDLWNGVGLTDIEDAAFAMHCQFSSFDDYWLPLTKKQRDSEAYLKGLSEDREPRWASGYAIIY